MGDKNGGHSFNISPDLFNFDNWIIWKSRKNGCFSDNY